MLGAMVEYLILYSNKFKRYTNVFSICFMLVCLFVLFLRGLCEHDWLGKCGDEGLHNRNLSTLRWSQYFSNIHNLRNYMYLIKWEIAMIIYVT